MVNEKNPDSAVNSLFQTLGGGSSCGNKSPSHGGVASSFAGTKYACIASPTPTSSTMARWVKNTSSAAAKISLRSLTCWDRKNRSSVDADSSFVNLAVGSQPIARRKALTDSPKNRPDCLLAIQPPKDSVGPASSQRPVRHQS